MELLFKQEGEHHDNLLHSMPFFCCHVYHGRKQGEICSCRNTLPWAAVDCAESDVFEMKLYHSVQETILDLFGNEITAVQSVSGGDINRA